MKVITTPNVRLYITIAELEDLVKRAKDKQGKPSILIKELENANVYIRIYLEERI